MTGIFFHRSNRDGWAGIKGNTAVSKGCPVINGGSWRDVERQLKKSNNIYFRVNR